MAFRPYFQWNGSIYTAQQALNFLNNQYPNARYTQIMERIGRTIHWGFNYTNLPTTIQQNLQAIYFKLEDYNFPLSNIKLEGYTDLQGKNYTRILIPAANLGFDFADIISQDFTVQVNQTGIAIYNVAGKANLYIDPITYSAPTITVTGYTTPAATFWDVWNASYYNSWNVINSQWQASYAPANTTPSQYTVGARIVIGDGVNATAFADTNKQVVFSDGILTGHWQALFQVTNASTATFGTVTNATVKQTINGISIVDLQLTYNHYLINVLSGGVLYFYSGHAVSASGKQVSIDLQANCRVWNSIIENSVFIAVLGSGEIFNVNSDASTATGLGYLCYASATGDRTSVTGALVTIYTQQNYNFTFTNLYARKYTYLAQLYGAWTGTGYLINADVDAWTHTFGATATGKVYRQYTFDLLVQDSTGAAIENATLSLLDNTGTEVLTDTLTNSSGLMDKQTVTRGFYNQTGGNTLYDKAPFLLNVTKTGYQSYVQNFTLTGKTDWIITLSESAASTEETNNAAIIWSLLFGSIAFGLFLLWRRSHA